MRALRAGRVSCPLPGVSKTALNRLCNARIAKPFRVAAEAAPGASGAATSRTPGANLSGDAKDKVTDTLSALDAFLDSNEAPDSGRAQTAPAVSIEASSALIAQPEPTSRAAEEPSPREVLASPSRAPAQEEVVPSLWSLIVGFLKDYTKPTTVIGADPDLPRSKPRLAYAVLALNILVYAFGLSFRFIEGEDGPTDFFLSLANVNDAIQGGEYYRIITANFLHDSFVHLCLSSYALLTIAPEAEAVLGPFAFLTTYVLGGAAGTTLCFLLTDTLTVGASSGIFGLIGALGAYLYKNHKVPHTTDQLYFTAGLVTFNLFMGGKQETAIDNLGHLGGLLCGIYLGMLLTAAVHKEPIATPPTEESLEDSRRTESSAAVVPEATASTEQQYKTRVVQPNPFQSVIVLLCVSTTLASSVAATVLYRTGELPIPRPPVWLM